MKFESARCPSCGGELRVPTDRDVVRCLYCGSEVIVREAIAAARTPRIETLLELAEAARDAGNYEDASTYYSRALELGPEARMAAKAWVGKGVSVCMLSTADDIRHDEAIAYLDIARSITPADDLETTTEIALAKTRVSFFTTEYVRQLGSLLYAKGDEVYNSFNRGIPFEAALAHDAAFPYIYGALERYEQALQYMPDATGVMKDIVSLLVEGPPVIERQFAEARIRKYVAKIRETEARYTPPRSSKYKKGRCLIATAAFGTDTAYEVRFLQTWRDKHLLGNTIGTSFVKLYYALGPYLATALSRSGPARRAVRKTLSAMVAVLQTVGSR